MIQKIKLSLSFIAVLWVIKIIDLLPINLNSFGITPRSVDGLWGIIFSPFLHGGFLHLFSNSIPLFVLIITLFFFYEKIAIQVIILSSIIGGSLLWLLGLDSMTNHIGASGLIFGLLSFLIVSGIIRKNIKSLLVGIAIFFMYGSALWGIFPSKPWVSWEGHLYGMVAGIVVAFLYKNKDA